MLSNEIWNLTSEEIDFIKTKQTKKRLAFALLFKSYQDNHEFIGDLTKLPRNAVKKVARILNVPPTIGEISSRTYDNYVSSIRKYFNTSFSTKVHYKDLTLWIRNQVLPTHFSSNEEIKSLITQHLKKMSIEPLKEKTLERIVVNAMNAYEADLFLSLKNSLSIIPRAVSLSGASAPRNCL